MSSNITLIQLRCFLGVVEDGGFTAAAERLRLTQSAVSQSVAALENSLGAPLLRRGRDGIALTAAGAAVLAEARLALAAVARLSVCAEGPDALTGPLRLGIVQSAAVRLLPRWMRALRVAHPGVAMTLYEGTDPEVLAWLRAGVVEVGVTSRTHPDLAAHPVHTDPYLVVVPSGHALASRQAIAMGDLDGHRMVMSGGGCETLIEELLRAADSHPDIVCVVRDNTTLFTMVREGIGLTIMPELALPANLEGVAVLHLRPALRRTLHILTMPQEVAGLTATAFRRLVTDHLPPVAG